MKKILMGIFTISTLSFSSLTEVALEENVFKNYQFLKGGTNLIKVCRYDIDVDYHKIDIQIKMRESDEISKFNEMDSRDREKAFSEIAGYVKNELKKNMNVQIIVEWDKNLEPNQIIWREIL